MTIFSDPTLCKTYRLRFLHRFKTSNKLMLEVMRDILQSRYLRSNVAHKQLARTSLSNNQLTVGLIAQLVGQCAAQSHGHAKFESRSILKKKFRVLCSCVTCFINLTEMVTLKFITWISAVQIYGNFVIFVIFHTNAANLKIINH